MNFNVVAPESIRSVVMLDADQKIDAMQSAWNAVGVNLEELKLYRIETNSTASIIDIIARKLAIEHRL